MDMVNQYAIYFVNLEPTVGAEVKKIRPCVVISPDEMNRYLKTVIIAPVTSTLRAYPTRIDLRLLNRDGQIMIDQLRAIDQSRLYSKIAMLDKASVEKVKSTVREMLVD
jgi:mRNA interferase MazF